MKRLYLLRHADTLWNSPSGLDVDRPLSNTGKKEATWIGNRLKKEPKIQAVLSSTAQRAKETCTIVTDIISFDKNSIKWDNELYHAKPEIIMEKIMEVNSIIQTLLVICHNPGLSDFASSLSIQVPYSLPTAGLFIIDVNTSDWKDFASATKEFISFEYPII